MPYQPGESAERRRRAIKETLRRAVQPLPLDEIARRVDRPRTFVLDALLELEVAGQVRRDGDGLWTRTAPKRRPRRAIGAVQIRYVCPRCGADHAASACPHALAA